MMMIALIDMHASSASPAIRLARLLPILERSFSFLGLVHFCNNLVRKCAAVSAYNSAAVRAGLRCRRCVDMIIMMPAGDAEDAS